MLLFGGNGMPNRLNSLPGFNKLRGVALIIAGAAFAAMALLMAPLQPARAATHEQFIEMCRQAHMEELRACVRGKVGNPRQAVGPELEKARQACGAVYVRPCVLAAEQKQATGVAAPSAPKDAAAPVPDAPLEIRASFVAPPRTIA